MKSEPTRGEWKAIGMTGNVWEWTGDAYLERLPGGADPAPTDGVRFKDGTLARVFRGGCWNVLPEDARVAFRLKWAPGNRVGILGFRLNRSFPAAAL